MNAEKFGDYRETRARGHGNDAVHEFYCRVILAEGSDRTWIPRAAKVLCGGGDGGFWGSMNSSSTGVEVMEIKLGCVKDQRHDT